MNDKSDFLGQSNRDPEAIAFREEEATLAQVERRIDVLVSCQREKATRCERELEGWRAIDAEDVARRQDLLRDQERAQAKAEELESYKPDPYFCRIEVSVEGGEPFSYCIGERALADAGQPLILDWRSPLGRTYANKLQRQFKVASPNGGGEHVYDLHLRRMVRIRDACLVEVTTEYDGANASLDGEVVDPFLLSVLRDKRRNYRLSNIVRTIQESQNTILERPLDESFVVQGCAGSGKTMILLHRLSYLAFNHPEIDFSKYLVLTPSESFNRQVDELCNQLEVGQVPRLTVESYYERIVTQLSRADVFYETDSEGRARKATPKVNVQSTGLTPEDSLNHDFLSAVYSTSFLEDVSEEFIALTNLVLGELRKTDARDLFEKCGFGPLVDDGAPYDIYRDLSSKCEKARRRMDESVLLVEGKRRQLVEVEEELSRFKASQESVLDALAPLRERAVSAGSLCVKEARSKLAALRQGRDALAAEIDAVSRQRDALFQGVERLSDDHKRAQSDVSTAEEAVSRISVEVNEGDPVVARKVEEACRKEALAVAELRDAYGGVGVFNLGKRRRIREELDKAEGAYNAAREAVVRAVGEERVARERAMHEERIERLRSQEHSLAAQLSDVQARLEKAEQQLAESNAKLRKFDAACGNLEAFANGVSVIVGQFEEADLPILRKDEHFANLEKLAPDLAAYVEACGKLSPTQRRDVEEGLQGLTIREERCIRAKEEFDCVNVVFSEEDKLALSQAKRLREELDIREFETVLSRQVNILAARHALERRANTHYRYELYLKAVLCLFYYGAPAVSGVCACVDEAQDLSPAEHILIKTSLGGDAVVNLYGDVNQLVYPYKGISEWSQLGDELPEFRFELQENYRNTIQVTEYCNATLGMDVTAVGLEGPEVEVVSLEEASARLLALRSEREGLRCAIIYSRKCKRAPELIGTLLGTAASIDSVEVGKIAVIPTELSKGLEFDAVAVVGEEMTPNEKYVAFTRSIEALIVAELPTRSCLELESDSVDLISGELVGEISENDRMSSMPEKRDSEVSGRFSTPTTREIV